MKESSFSRLLQVVLHMVKYCFESSSLVLITHTDDDIASMYRRPHDMRYIHQTQCYNSVRSRFLYACDDSQICTCVFKRLAVQCAWSMVWNESMNEDCQNEWCARYWTVTLSNEISFYNVMWLWKLEYLCWVSCSYLCSWCI